MKHREKVNGKDAVATEDYSLREELLMNKNVHRDGRAAHLLD